MVARMKRSPQKLAHKRAVLLVRPPCARRIRLFQLGSTDAYVDAVGIGTRHPDHQRIAIQAHDSGVTPEMEKAPGVGRPNVEEE